MKNSVWLLTLLIFLCLSITGQIIAEDNLNEQLEKVSQKYRKYYNEDNKEKKVGYLKEITSIFEKLVDEYPEEVELYWGAADSYSELAEYIEEPLDVLEKGRKYAEMSIEIAPDKGRGYFWLAAFMGQIGQEKGIFSSLSMVKPMRNNLEKAIELEPDFAPAYDIMARLYINAPGWPISIGSNKKALEYRKKSVELDPDDYIYKWRLYENYKELKKYDKARETLQEIIDMPVGKEDPEFVEEYKKSAREAMKELDEM